MKIALIAVGAVLAIIVVLLVVLASVDMPAPSAQIEKPIPADKLIH